MRIKQSLCYPIFLPKGMTLDELFRIGASVGYAAVELWNRGDDLEEVVETAKAFGCSRYTEGCGLTLWKTLAGLRLDKKLIRQLASVQQA